MREISTEVPDRERQTVQRSLQRVPGKAREEGMCIDCPSSALCLLLIFSKCLGFSSIQGDLQEEHAEQGSTSQCRASEHLTLQSKQSLQPEHHQVLQIRTQFFPCGILLHISWASKGIDHSQAMLGSKHYNLISVCCM